MLYKKPNNLKYTTMAIYIDENIYKPDHDQETIYKYLYFLAIMLAHKENLFNIEDEYEEFAIYYASQLYLRLTNKKQFEYNDAGEPKLKRVKSILNYMKSTIGQRAAEFDKYEYDYTSNKITDDVAVSYSFRQLVSESTDFLGRVEFEACLGDIIKGLRAYLTHIPYSENSIIYNNIYLSCLLSFLNSIVLDSRSLKKLSNSYSPEQLEALYKKQNKDFVILFHLPAEMKGYIQTLTNGMKHYIAKDLSWKGRDYISSHSNMLSLLANSISNNEGQNE